MIVFVVFLSGVAILATLGVLLWRELAGPSRSLLASTLRGVSSLCLALFVVGFASWKLSNARTLQVLGQIVPRVATGDSVLAITFDDGPLPGATEHMRRILSTSCPGWRCPRSCRGSRRSATAS